MNLFRKKGLRVATGILLLLGFAGAYGLFQYYKRFDQMVLEKFEGRLWEVPARVYARPMDLYPGLRLNPDTFEQALGLMNYEKAQDSAQLSRPGQYTKNGGTFSVFRRSFEWEDEHLPSKKMEVQFDRKGVQSIKVSGTGEPVNIARFDPALIGAFYPRNYEDRVLLSLKDVPPLLTRSLIAVEDRSFYEHHGVVPLAILRALAVNIRSGRAVQGASTITQQLAKNFFLTSEKSIKRKLDELMVAISMEQHFSKDEILETYLNEVYLGQDGKRAIHGFGLAASFYFGRPLKDLKPHEIALLVGMLKGPSRYNPRKYSDRALVRRNTVLAVLREAGILSPDTARAAMKAPLGVTERYTKGISPFPAAMDLIKRQLLREYRESDLRTAGLCIFTTLDLQSQLTVEEAVASGLRKIESQRRLPAGKLEAGAVVTTTGSNEVLAVVGGREPRRRGFNRALDAHRAIGSLIKPAVFLTALKDSEHYTLVTPLEDRPVKVINPGGTPWNPQNYDRKYHGTIPLYEALVHSYNASTVRLGMALGLPAVLETLKSLGFEKTVQMYPAFLLGTVEMSPLEVSQIYQTFAAGGFYTPICIIHAIYKPDGSVLERYPFSISQRFDPGPVYLLNCILQAVVTEGSAGSLTKMVPSSWHVAGKTGTTNDLRDSWFCGFTGNQLAVVWVGRDDNQPCGLTGAAGAMRVWGRFMGELPNIPLVLIPPENIVTFVVNKKTGLHENQAGPNALKVPFIKGSEPWQPGRTDVTGGRRFKERNIQKKESETGFVHWLKEIFK